MEAKERLKTSAVAWVLHISTLTGGRWEDSLTACFSWTWLSFSRISFSSWRLCRCRVKWGSKKEKQDKYVIKKEKQIVSVPNSMTRLQNWGSGSGTLCKPWLISVKSTINKIRQTLKNLTLKTFIGKSTTASKKKKNVCSYIFHWKDSNALAYLGCCWCIQ